MPHHGDDPLPPAPQQHRRLTRRSIRRFARGSWPWRQASRRADGLAGPTGRYAFIVAVLVTMTTLPVYTAVSAGSSTIRAAALPEVATSFMTQPSDGPVVVPVTSSTLAPADGRPAAARPASAGRASGDTDRATEKASRSGRRKPVGRDRGRGADHQRAGASRDRARPSPQRFSGCAAGQWCRSAGPRDTGGPRPTGSSGGWPQRPSHLRGQPKTATPRGHTAPQRRVTQTPQRTVRTPSRAATQGTRVTNARVVVAAPGQLSPQSAAKQSPLSAACR